MKLHSPIIRELVELSTDYHGIKDGISFLLELNDELKNKDLDDAIYDMCLEKYLCKDCLEFAEPRKEKEGRPYGDTVAYEEIIYMVCPECGEEIE